MVRALERGGDAVGAVLRAAKNDDGIVVHAFEQREQQVGLLRVGNGIDDVLDVFGGRTTRANFNRLRIVHRPLDERFDLRRNRGGKKRGVTFARTLFHEASHVGQKPHVEHPVGFVEHEKFHLVQFQSALFQVIQQTSGRRGNDVRAGFQFVILFSITDAAEDDGGFQIGETRIIADGRFNLRRKFAGWFKNQCAWADGIMRAKFGKNWQRKRRRFSRASLRAADDILAGQHKRNCAQLNRRRFGVAHGANAFEHLFTQSQRGETHATLPSVATGVSG